MSQQKRYSEYENSWKKSNQLVNHELKLAQGFNVADTYLNRTYLDNFSAALIVPASRSVMDTSKIRIVEVSKLVFDENEKFTDKLMSVYSALHSLNSAVALIIDSDGDRVRFYIGVRSDVNTSIAGDVLESTLKGNFPGIVFCSMDVDHTKKLMADIRDQCHLDKQNSDFNISYVRECG